MSEDISDYEMAKMEQHAYDEVVQGLEKTIKTGREASSLCNSYEYSRVFGVKLYEDKLQYLAIELAKPSNRNDKKAIQTQISSIGFIYNYLNDLQIAGLEAEESLKELEENN